MGPYSITQMRPERGRVCVICLVNRGPPTSRLAVGGAGPVHPGSRYFQVGQGLPCQPTTGDSAETWAASLPRASRFPTTGQGRRSSPSGRWNECPVAGWEGGDTAFIICCRGILEELLSFCLLLINVGINTHPGIRGEGPSWNVLSF